MTKLFTPLHVGGRELAHRVVMAPLTRYRCDDDWIPLPIVKGGRFRLQQVAAGYTF